MPSALSIARPAGAAVLLFAAVLGTAAVLYVSWPAGVAVGIVAGTVAIVAIGARMQRTDRLEPVDTDLAERLGMARTAPAAVPVAVAAPEPEAFPVVAVPALHVQPDILYFTSDDDPDVAEARELVAEPRETALDPVRTDLETLKADLGEDYRDFARAARLVVSTQYASAARLQRDLDLPYSRARRLLSDLEQQHFVGPATGSLPRQVLLPIERLPEVERLLADA